MATCGYGNFGFMYTINQEIYWHLNTAERNARLPMNTSLYNSIRQALECFVWEVIEDKGLQSYILQSGEPLTSVELFYQIEALNDMGEMRRARYLKANETFKNKPLLPFSQSCWTVQYILNTPIRGNQCHKQSYYDYLRLFGNACSHSREVKRIQPKFCYDNLLKCLTIFHKILKAYYNQRTVPDFNEQRMPIENYIIDADRKPIDSELSKCEREFDAHVVDSAGNPETYALIRLYRRHNVDETFLHRNNDCFLEAMRASMGIAPKSMASVKVLGREDLTGEFFIIAYTFYAKATPLNAALLRQLALPQRKALCRDLAICLAELHKIHIYHRLLNYTCVYVTQTQTCCAPFIVKFDYAKIDMREKGTVFAFADDAKTKLQQSGREKYIPPEWQDKTSNAGDVDWAKVDVYSLGVLMADILAGTIHTTAREAFCDLEEMGLEDDWLDLLDGMMAQAPAARCTMAAVRSYLERGFVDPWN